MKLDVSDLKRLRWAIAFLLLLAALGGGAVWASLWLTRSADKGLREVSAAHKEIQSRLVRARDEEQELRDKIARFQQIASAGRIGPEQRLEWIEAIARIRSAHRLAPIEYEFSPQRPLDAVLLPGGAIAGKHEVLASAMRFKLPLLHEGDLLNFLAELRQQVPALIVVRTCVIERVPPTTPPPAMALNLVAECTLEWVTLKERSP